MRSGLNKNAPDEAGAIGKTEKSKLGFGGSLDRRSLTGLLDQGLGGVRRLGTLADPVVRALDVERELLSFGTRVVGAEDLSRTAIAAGAGFRNYDVVDRSMRCADTGEANLKSHGSVSKTGYLLVKS
jgi:hypothetical protein